MSAQTIRDSELLKKELKSLAPDQLLTVYGSYTQKFNQTIDVQWKITSIFVPLSLSGIIGGLVSPALTVFIGAFSILLVWTWYLFVRRNGYDLRGYYTIVVTIESILVKHESDGIGPGFSIPKPRTGRDLSYTRLFGYITLAITTGWTLFILYILIF